MGIKFTPASAEELAERGVPVEQPAADDAKTPANDKPKAAPKPTKGAKK
jgi:hypothetical protein